MRKNCSVYFLFLLLCIVSSVSASTTFNHDGYIFKSGILEDLGFNTGQENYICSVGDPIKVKAIIDASNNLQSISYSIISSAYGDTFKENLNFSGYDVTVDLPNQYIKAFLFTLIDGAKYSFDFWELGHGAQQLPGEFLFRQGNYIVQLNENLSTTVLSGYGFEASNVNPVPIPSAAILLTSGILGIMVLKRKATRYFGNKS